MLQVGARTSEAERSFASSARSFRPTSWTNSGSQVDPIAVDDWTPSKIMQYITVQNTYRETFCWRAHEEMVSSDTVWTIANLETHELSSQVQSDLNAP